MTLRSGGERKGEQCESRSANKKEAKNKWVEKKEAAAMKKKKRSTEQDEMRTERGTRATLLRKMNAGKVATDKKRIEAKLTKHNRRHDYIERD